MVLVKELPDLKHGFKVVSGSLVELPLGSNKLFLVLLLHHFQIELEESLNLGNLLHLHRVKTLVKLVKHHEQPLVKLKPFCREVILDKKAGDQS